jgi:O-antigen/teichoic acid export membrane protein/SAM-dependent methyltransferase
MNFWRSFFSQAKTKTAKQTGLLFLAQMGVILLGIITVPIISRTLGPDDYGKYALVLAVVTFIASFFEFGFFSAGARLLATAKDEKEERDILGGLYFVAAAIAVFFALTIWILSFFIDRWLSSNIGSTLQIIAPLAAFFPVQFMIQQIAQGSNRIGRLAAVTILPGLWMLAAILTLSHVGNITVLTVLTANMISLFLVAVLVLFTFRASWKRLWKSVRLLSRETKSYGRDVYIGRVIGGSMFDLDKFFISRFVSAASVGYYTLAILVVSPMVILSQSFASTLFKGFAQQDRVPAKVTFFNFLWLVCAAVFLILVGPFVINLLFTERFAPVSGLLLPLAVAGIFQGMYQPYNNFLGAHGQGKYLRNISFVFALFSVVFNFILVRQFGAMGAAVATLISNATYFSLCLYCYLIYIQRNSSDGPSHAFSKEYFEELYKNTREPWGLDRNASQLVRYDAYLKLLAPYLHKEAAVLDIGCGKGYFTQKYAPLVKKVVGIDISEEAVRQGQPGPNVEYKVGSLPKLEFKDQSFDIALPLEVLYYLTEEEQHIALHEISRVLTPAGIALFSVNIGRKPYYQLDELKALLSKDFEILIIQPGFGRLYTFWENKILILEPTPLGGLTRIWLKQRWLVPFFQALSRLIYGRKGITMAAVLVRNK